MRIEKRRGVGKSWVSHQIKTEHGRGAYEGPLPKLTNMNSGDSNICLTYAKSGDRRSHEIIVQSRIAAIAVTLELFFRCLHRSMCQC